MLIRWRTDTERNTSAFQVQNNECNSNVTAIASYEIETYNFYLVNL